MSSLLKLQVEDLYNAIDKLPAKDHKFARDLCGSFFVRGLTEKQAYWVGELLKRVENPQATLDPIANVGNLAAIMALFKKAEKNLKRPSVVLLLGDQQIELAPARGNTRYPGSIHISAAKGDGYYGRITPEGNYIHVGRYVTCDTVLLANLLQQFATDPARIAGEHGRLMDKCCFCNKLLSDERSAAVGYGHTCATNWGLPWGAKAARAANEAHDLAFFRASPGTVTAFQ